jgi:RNA polymerase sigma-70 factor (ECF subfamily)
VRPIHRLSGIVAACLLIGVAFTQTWSVAQHTEPSPLKPSQKGQESLAVTNQPGDPKGLIQLTVLKTHNGLLYEGRVMTWDEIENQLSTIANPRDYFLALGETDVDSTFPVGGVRAFSLEARRGASIVTRLGFAYFSYIGKQPQPSIQGEPAGTSSMDIGAPVIEDDYEGAMADEIAQSYAKSSTDVQDFLRLTAKSFGPLSLWLPEVPYDVIRLSPAERADLTACTDRLLAELQSETYGRHLCENLVAASEIRDERLVPMLLRIAAYHRDDQDYDCRPKWMAIAALARQENESAVPTLVRLVDHGNLNTRMWAQAALARITGQSFGADKQTWANWWNGAGKTPAITADDIKPWTPPASTKVAQAQTTTPSPPAENAKPPQIVSTVPKIGDTAVPADTKELRVTFDQDMAAGFSWTGGGPAFPESAGKAQWLDKRTCVFPVKLQPGKYYRLGINAPSFKNFQSTSGLPAPVTSFWFVTAGADGKPVDGLQAPKIVELSPANGAKDVASTTTELVARFDRPMSEGASWTNPEDKIPEITGKPTWRDNKTCALSVKLEPGKEYVFSLNDAWFINFQSAEGVPLVPVRYTFSTSAETSQSTAAGQAQVSTTKGVPAHAEMRNDSEIRFASSKELVIEIPADNSYVVFGKTLTVSELKELLRTCVASFPSVDVRAHPSASVSAVRSAVAYAKAAGFHEITMFGPLVDVAVREPIRNSREPATPRPQLIASAPAIGDTSVPTGTKELRLTFDQDMLADEHLSCGFVGFTDLEMKLSWPDPRTAVITVAPQPGVVSTIVFNNEQAAEKGWPVFRNKAGVPALPFTIWFINRNADGTPARDKVPPAVIELSPANGDTAVSPNTTELLVHFDRKMRPTTAWGNVDGRFPELTGKPYWREDSMTCVLPVKLTPGKDYVLSLNDARFVDFESAEGVPLLPVRYTFSTKGN